MSLEKKKNQHHNNNNNNNNNKVELKGDVMLQWCNP